MLGQKKCILVVTFVGNYSFIMRHAKQSFFDEIFLTRFFGHVIGTLSSYLIRGIGTVGGHLYVTAALLSKNTNDSSNAYRTRINKGRS